MPVTMVKLGKPGIFANLPFFISEILSVGLRSEVSIPSQQLLNMHYQNQLAANNLESALRSDVTIAKIMSQVPDVSDFCK